MARQIGNRAAWRQVLLWGVFGVYLVILAALLFMKDKSVQSVNLVPFRTIADYMTHDRPLALSNVLGNVAMFLPLGVYLPLLQKRGGAGRAFAWIVGVSVMAEIMQYVFRVGAADIDDVILNGLGGLIGVGLYRLLSLVFGEKVRAVIVLLSLAAGALFLTAAYCLWTGVWGIRIL